MSCPVIRDPEGRLIEPLRGQPVAIIGFGNQGAAHAANLRDSGIEVIIGARAGASGDRAREAGFTTVPIADAAGSARLIILALPDEVQPEVFADSVAPHLRDDAIVGFLHGFNVCYGLIRIEPRHGAVLVAPKGPGTTLRDRYRHGLGIPCLFAIGSPGIRADAEVMALAWASAIGCGRAAIVATTFAHETESDLFGEQAVLCGGMSELIVAAFETLVAAGYPPELAYVECCHEVKQVADLVYERGLAGMRAAISNTAEFGACAAGPRVVDDRVRASLRALLDDIQSGAFARRLRADHARGFPWFRSERHRLDDHPIEAAGAAVRGWMQRAVAGSGADSAVTEAADE